MVTIDEGATKALINGKKSLLATGVVNISGKFDMGDIIEVADINENIIAKGIVNYRTDELLIIKGKKTNEIKSLLNGHFFDEVINRYRSRDHSGNI